MKKAALIFLGVFLASCLVQGHLWAPGDYLDNSLWVPAVEQIAAGTLPGPTEPTYGYPATTLLMPASFLVERDMTPESATATVLTLLLSLLIACSALAAYVLRPQTPWWLAASSLLILTNLYQNATPPSALAMGTVTLLSLLVLLAYERKGETLPFVLLGLAGGLSLATRIDISSVMLALALVFLALFSFRRAVLAGAIALLAFHAFDPYLYLHPVSHLIGIYDKVHHLYAPGVGVSTLPFMRLGKTIPLGVLGVIFGIILFFRQRAVRPYLAWLIAFSLALFAILLSSSFHPDWYFFPLLIAWQTLLPFLLFTLLEGADAEQRLFGFLPKSSLPLLLTLILLLGQFVVYLHPAHLITN